MKIPIERVPILGKRRMHDTRMNDVGQLYRDKLSIR